MARGAGSGLSGGATPVEDGVLIGLSRMRRILEVDLANGRVLVEPGVTNIAVSQAVGPTHFYPPDPSSQIVCTIGGNVAENSGGAHCFKYGFTTNYVTGLELVLPDGSELTLGGPGARPSRVRPAGRVRRLRGHARRRHADLAASGPEARGGAHARRLLRLDGAGRRGRVRDRLRRASCPGAIEMMDNLSIRAAEGATGAGYPMDAGAALVVELDGSEAECETRFERGRRDLRGRRRRLGARGPGRGRARADLAHAQGGLRGHGPDRPELLRAGQRDPAHPAGRGAAAGSTSSPREHDLRVANVFHAGDGNLHPLVCYDGAKPGEAERAEELAGLIVKACVDAGGSITGEHGVGVDKKRYMPEMFDEADLSAFQRLRCAFDPEQRANPGKVMPTPRLCGEVPGPYRRAPARAGRPRGALLMAVTGAPGHARGARAAARGRGRRRRARCASRGGGTKLGWGAAGPERAIELSDGRPRPHRRAQRGRPHRGARGGRAARARAGGVRRGGPDAGARPAGRRRHARRRRGHRRLRPAARPLRRRARPGRRACAWRSRTARSPRAAAR